MGFKTLPNQRTVNVKLTRKELDDLILACTEMVWERQNYGGTGEKWKALRDKLAEQRDAFDAKIEEG